MGYYRRPSKISLKKSFVYAKNTINAIDANYKAEINHMSNVFIRKQRAIAAKLVSHNETGRIDTNLIHQYKYSDKIFGRSENHTSGNNHGLLVMLDSSGSMARDNIAGSLIQIRNLIKFCTKSNIPFRVVIFKNVGGARGKDSKGNVVTSRATLREWFSSQMNKKELDAMTNYVFRNNGCGSSHWLDSMGGCTPLADSITMLRQYAFNFVKEENIQLDKLTTVIITDGASGAYSAYNSEHVSNDNQIHRASQDTHGLGQINGTIVDPKFNTTTKVDTRINCATLLKHYKKLLPGKLMGYYIGNNPGLGLSTYDEEFGTGKERTEVRNEIYDKKFVSLKNFAGYDEMTFIDIDMMKVGGQNVPHSFRTYKHQEKTDFMDELKEKKNRKKILVDFVNSMA